MANRIVVFGATGYTGRLTAERLVAQGERPILAGRSAARLQELAARLGDGVETQRADVTRRNSVMELVGEGDVLISTVGPFAKHGEPAVQAAVAAGATYMDTTGEPQFIRRVFEEFGPAAARTGADLLTAMGYDYVPGALAAGLALREAGEAAARADVGYYAFGMGPAGLSAGTKESMAGVLTTDHFAWRDGALQTVRPVERVRSFAVRGRDREAISIGGAEHFTLPEAYPRLREVNVYVGGFPGIARGLQAATAVGALAAKLPGVSTVARVGAERAMAIGPSAGEGGDASGTTVVVATVHDAGGRQLGEVRLAGVEPYDFTAGFLAWAARRAAADAIGGTGGALGPVAAFGLDELEAGCREAGLARVGEPGA